ncbi:MAG: helix-turn-helix domain-containing protein [Phaeodactylibacter sp.]|nr:helix-turn-helix domain-containing protein [Phaeodactylibacter sp.]
MKLLKPTLEKIEPAIGSSFAIKQYSDPCRDKKPFWHFHPELELVYVKGGTGKRHIGNHLSNFTKGDLVFIGSNLPHTGFTDRLTGNESETIVQMRSDFLGGHFFEVPEMQNIQQLFHRARLGLAFYGRTKKELGARLEHLPKLDPFHKLIELLSILDVMAQTSEYHILNAEGFALEVNHQDNDRINIIYRYVRENFHQQITLEEIAGEVNMTVPAFCRYFKKISRRTFTRFLIEYRIVHACNLLVKPGRSISEVCLESGFNNFSHFNRLFKERTGKSPSEYRKTVKMLVE